ncbi:hypothetical protein KI387_017573, partial [Taxus chinensis]
FMGLNICGLCILRGSTSDQSKANGTTMDASSDGVECEDLSWPAHVRQHEAPQSLQQQFGFVLAQRRCFPLRRASREMDRYHEEASSVAGKSTAESINGVSGVSCETRCQTCLRRGRGENMMGYTGPIWGGEEVKKDEDGVLWKRVYVAENRGSSLCYKEISELIEEARISKQVGMYLTVQKNLYEMDRFLSSSKKPEFQSRASMAMDRAQKKLLPRLEEALQNQEMVHLGVSCKTRSQTSLKRGRYDVIYTPQGLY